MAEFAIVRIEKKSKMADVRGLAGHHLRTDPVPNSDPARGIKILIGPDNPHDVTNIFRERTKPLVKRKDSVRCFDVFLGMSPGWTTDHPDKLDEFAERALHWVTSYFGESNVVTLVRHDDEKTQGHLHALITPIFEGKLQAKHWTGGKEKMRQMQDSFAEAMQPLGLHRGVKGSRARHEQVQHWYGTLEPRLKAAQETIDAADKVMTQLDDKAAQNTRKEAANRLGESVMLQLEKSLKSRTRALVEERQKLEAELVELEREKNIVARLKADLQEKASKLRSVWHLLPAALQSAVRAAFKPQEEEAKREKERIEQQRVPEEVASKRGRFIAPKPKPRF